MFSKTRLTTIVMVLVVLAAIYRIDPAKDALTGDTKFLGIF